MWTRKIILVGSSRMCVLPPDVLHGMKWERGDVLVLQILGPNKVQLSKLNPAPDTTYAQAIIDIGEDVHAAQRAQST
jgi:hypothetical protein